MGCSDGVSCDNINSSLTGNSTTTQIQPILHQHCRGWTKLQSGRDMIWGVSSGRFTATPAPSLSFLEHLADTEEVAGIDTDILQAPSALS